MSPKNFTIGATAMMSKTMMSKTQPQRSDGAELCALLQRHNHRSKRAAVDGAADVPGQEICGLDRA